MKAGIRPNEQFAPGDVVPLMDSWRIHLEAENLSAKTIKSYMEAGKQLRQSLVATGMPTDVSKISREHIEHFLVDLMNRTSASTAATRYRGLQQLFKWLAEEGEITESPMIRMKPPKLDESPVPVVARQDLQKLLAICNGRSFEDRRDTAIIRVFLNTGARLGEMAGIRLDDVDLGRREIRVLGKGKKARDLPIGPKATKAVDRYLRERARHSQRDEVLTADHLKLGPPRELRQDMLSFLQTRATGAPMCGGIGVGGAVRCRPRDSHGGSSARFPSPSAGPSSRPILLAASAATERAKQAHRRLSPGEDL